MKPPEGPTTTITFTNYVDPRRLLTDHVLRCESELKQYRAGVAQQEHRIAEANKTIAELEKSRQDTLDLLKKLGIERPAAS